MWRIIKVIPPEHLGVFRVALDSVRNTYNRLDMPVEANFDAYKVYKEGLRGYIDALYYSTSKIS
ncbi:MAG: hypothetical protein QXK88_04255 [Desulfurococcaceae archaeon]